MALRDTISDYSRTVAEELQKASGQPEARSVDYDTGRSTRYNRVARQGKADKHYPEREDLERYWEIYKEVSIIRDPIRSFSSEVVGPGYYIDTENEDLKEDVEEWLESSSIVGGEIDKDFTFLLKKAQIQREVKGTVFCEKVEDEDGELYGFKLVQPETMRAFTKPGQTVLLPPDYDVDSAEEQGGIMESLVSKQDFYENDDGEVAAYVQMDQTISGSDDGYYIPFTRDQIIKLDRDSDIGSIFGESRIAAVEDRLNSLLSKLEDNDAAIESVSQPFQLFKFGTGEDGPWEPEEIKSFMNEHSSNEFEPGMKQGVQGDMEVDTVSGDVAEIKEFLDWDLNWIISEMPMPLYSLGAFTSDVNQFISRSQSARLERQVEEARKEIEKEWTPVVKQKAEEMGYDPEEVESLVIGEDPSNLNFVKDSDGNMVPEDGRGLPENSEGDATNPAGNNSNTDNTGAAGENESRPPASSEPNRDGGGGIE